MVQLDGRYRFENFVVGSASRLAVAAARAVAEAPGAVYNPLFIYSGSGLGKTHLLAATGHHARQLQPGLVIEYVTLEQFVEQLHAAISEGMTEAFAQRYQHVEVLLLDDVQFLTGHRETQSEMLRLFNALQELGRQIVMTSDRPPAEIADVDERLLNRLAGGLIVDIGPPDYETRMAILRSKCEERGMQFRPGVIEELAEIEFGNVRALQGALNRLIAHQALGEGQVSPDQVRALFGGEAAAAAARPAASPSGEFFAFVSGIANTVAEQVDQWRVRLGEAIVYWRGEGYRTAVLERALQQPRAPDVDGLVAAFTAAVDRLRELENCANGIDPLLGGDEAFRDPERVADAEALLERAMAGHLPPAGPSEAFTRSGFEVGPSNQLAVRAADAVVEAPASRYNPLFIHGPSGVGKTHLAHAIGNELVHASGGAIAVSCISAQTFIDELIAALQEGSIDRWRRRYRSAGALIIDDVQFVAGKERTQEELFHVFNTLYGEGKQLVFTCDVSPKEVPELEERLRSRFEGGLVVAIQIPDQSLRERLYARQLAEVVGTVDSELLAFLADRPVASVREILGTVNRLVAAADIANVPLTIALARAELDGIGTAPAPAPTSVLVPVDSFFLDDEKIIWDWPDVSGRAIEELR